MVSDKENTEQRIIDAAISIFVRKGYDGSRMQEIADEAEINKALLHYYFRSKDKLFARAFGDVFSIIIDSLTKIAENEDSIEELLEAFVNVYIDLLKTKPNLPNFVLNELNRRPQILLDIFKSKVVNKAKIVEFLSNQGNRTDLRNFNPIHVIVNVVSMSVFPFAASPIITGFIFDGDKNAYNNFIDERKEHIVSFVKAAILIN